jgi:hypothetical protein
VADNNNALAGKLPKTPYPELKQLEPLIGRWKISSPNPAYPISGTVTYEWMVGGFFMIAHLDQLYNGVKVKGVEYVGFDEDTRTLRSHFMDIRGCNFTYTYDINGDSFFYWFGEKGSNNFARGAFSNGGNTITGRWQWQMSDGKAGGYEYEMNRVK